MKFIVKKISSNGYGYDPLVTMKMYSVSCKKSTTNKNSSVINFKQNKLMILSNCPVCSKNKMTFIKNKTLHNFNNIWND